MWVEEGEEGDTLWWWNEEVEEAISRRKDAHKSMCGNSTVERKNMFESIMN